MEKIKIENLTFSYPNCAVNALSDINLEIGDGEFILLCGKSGCGKTTLLRLMKPPVAPGGCMSGNITVDGKILDDLTALEQAQKIGYVMQDPENQIVCDKVWHELSFGLENLSVPKSEIRSRVAEMASFFGINNWFHKKVSELSGGQKQILNLASVMVMRPSVLLLDEPRSQLDPIAADNFINTLKKINRELGTTIIMSEHRTENIFSIADKVCILQSGKVISYDSPHGVCKILAENKNDMYFALPTSARLFYEYGETGDCPLTIRGAREWLSTQKQINTIECASVSLTEKQVCIELKDVFFRYEKDSDDVIKGLSLKIMQGEIYSLLGSNGAGKSTIADILAGINKPYRGKIKIDTAKRTALLPQNPRLLFSQKSVMLELENILSEADIPPVNKSDRLQNVIKLCSLKTLLSMHPYDISGGEQQRVAFAMILLKDPDIILLDEPTKGLDAYFKTHFGQLLTHLKKTGKTIITVSHDIEFCAEYSDRCALLFDGRIVSEDVPGHFFPCNAFFTTAANRISKGYIENAVSERDILYALGRKTSDSVKNDTMPFNDENSNCIAAYEKSPPQKTCGRIRSKNMIVSVAVILLMIPLTIYLGIHFLGDRKYYFISLLIIFETLIPFSLLYESRRPKARELAVISVMCALSVCGRILFAFAPQFKPSAAVIIITGAALGGECGFLVGALTGFISNFFFGQGPWTPWQMFSFGMIGFASGLFFSYFKKLKNKNAMAVFGFAAVLVIYGGIMNPASVIMQYPKPNITLIAAAYISGFTFDLIHALSTMFFIWAASEPICDKIERVKIKYGFME